MMIKLYKVSEGETRYWEAWNYGDIVIFHTGLIGETGKKDEVLEPVNSLAEELMRSKANEQIELGFRELNDDESIVLVIKYRLPSFWGEPEDLERRQRIEDILNEHLGWTGNGMCDGGDIGSGEMCVYCYVVDVMIAARTIIVELENHGLLNGAIIASRRQDEDDYTVIWPPNYAEPF